MGLIALVIFRLLQVYFFVMVARFALDLIRSFKRTWRPSGLLLVLVELTFTLTDPPLKLARKIVPSVRMGSIQFDFSWTMVFFGVWLLQRLAIAFI
jgi:YggT family protein